MVLSLRAICLAARGLCHIWSSYCNHRDALASILVTAACQYRVHTHLLLHEDHGFLISVLDKLVCCIMLDEMRSKSANCCPILLETIVCKVIWPATHYLFCLLSLAADKKFCFFAKSTMFVAKCSSVNAIKGRHCKSLFKSRQGNHCGHLRSHALHYRHSFGGKSAFVEKLATTIWNACDGKMSVKKWAKGII